MGRRPKKQTKSQKQRKFEKQSSNNLNGHENNKISHSHSHKSNNNHNISKKNTKKRNRKSRKNDIDEKFKKHLESLGYFIREVGGDGNCLFRSVSEQMEGNEKHYKDYREICVDYMRKNKEAFIPFIEDDEPIDKYIDRMSENKEWGGNLEIYALSMALKANFYIYIHEHSMYAVKNFEKPKKNITLTYHEGKHYNSLRKLEEKNKEDKEKEEKKKKYSDSEEEEEDDDSEEDEKHSDDINDLISQVDILNI